MSTTIDWISCPYCGYESAYSEMDYKAMETFSSCPECGWDVENGREIQAGKRGMDGYLDKLRWEVIETGQKTRDSRKIPSDVHSNVPLEGLLKYQILQDSMRQYKYYDALGMWIGQSQFWTEEEQAYLKELAEDYLERGGK